MRIITYLKSLEFANPALFWLLLLIPLVVGWYIWKHKKINSSFTISTIAPLSSKGYCSWVLHIPFILRIFTLILLIIALARPQSSYSHKQIDVEGIDIVLALDVSGSMMAMDFRPTRLDACKDVIKHFVQNRPTDRMALVVYAGEAYTKCPLTTDHITLLASLESTNNNFIEDGTAIGDGLGTAINRLRNSEVKSKVIILLSDGVNNSGYIDPISAAELAKEFGIRVYTIGCGSMGEAPYKNPYGSVFYAKTEIDEKVLKTIADKTDGKYFRAQNKNKLTEIYNEIDKMEKSKISETQFTNKTDVFFPFLFMAIIFFVVELILSTTILNIKS